MTRVLSQTRERSITRDATSSTSEAFITDGRKNSPRLDHVTLFKRLNNLLDDEIKPAIEAQFTELQNMFTQRIEDTMNRRMTTLPNITVEAMNLTNDQIREDNAQLRT